MKAQFPSKARALGGGVATAAVALVGLACADVLASNRDSRDASVSFGVTQEGALVGSANNVAAIVITGNGNSVDLQSADVVFSEVTFEGDDVEPNDNDDSDFDSDSDREGNARFRSGAVTVALPLQGGVITPFTGRLPDGTYDRVEMDAEFLRLRGTYNGEAFDVTIPVNSELELRLDPPLVVSSTSDPINVSVTIDVARWFRDANGNVIDPRQLATNSTLREQFRSRVRASFDAFEDEDRDADDQDSDSDSENGA